MHEARLTKKRKCAIIKNIENGRIQIWYDDKWKYPQQGDDEKMCPMLHMNFQIEYKGGHVIFIPDEVKKTKRISPMSAKDMRGEKT